MVFICGCGKEYKFATGLSKHEATCKKSGLAASTVVVDNVKVSEKPASMAIDIPLPKLMPNSSFTQADLELLEKKKQARMLAIQKAEREDEERLRKQEEMKASKAKPIFTATIPVTSTSTTTTSTTTSGRVAAAAAAASAASAAVVADEEDEDEEEYQETSERIITFEKMTYLVLALIEQNGQLQKENEALKLELVKKAIISSLNTGSSISPS